MDILGAGRTLTEYVENCWADYKGTDVNRDVIGDISYIINKDAEDRYPLMRPIENYGT
jgi:hypothetical protein